MSKSKNVLKSWGLLSLALVIAGVAFWLTVNYLSSKEVLLRNQILNEKVQKISVVVASSDLQAGDVVSLKTMALAEVDGNNVSAFAIKPEDFSRVEGKIIRFPMSSGEPLLSHFMAGDAIERFSDLLSENERAVTLEIDSLNSAAGMLVAGDYIDVMLLMEDGSVGENAANTENKNLRPLLQNVRVLSVDAFPLHSKKQDFVIAANAEGMVQYSNITVGVKFEDASKLVLARDLGNLVYMLRNKKDHHLQDATLISKLDLNESTSTKNSYQFYSAANGGAISPTVKLIESMPDINRSKRVFSRPIVPIITSANQTIKHTETVTQENVTK